jgi:hypothetical protein
MFLVLFLLKYSYERKLIYFVTKIIAYKKFIDSEMKFQACHIPLVSFSKQHVTSPSSVYLVIHRLVST